MNEEIALLTAFNIHCHEFVAERRELLSALVPHELEQYDNGFIRVSYFLHAAIKARESFTLDQGINVKAALRAIPARLDADRNAKPLTSIGVKMDPRNCFHGVKEFHNPQLINRETGEKIPLFG